MAIRSRRSAGWKWKAGAEKKIIVGDLNALPQMHIIGLIEQTGYRNLVSEHAITDMSTVCYDKPIRLVGYAFVSETVKVEAFRVDQSPVSDHAALILTVTSRWEHRIAPPNLTLWLFV